MECKLACVCDFASTTEGGKLNIMGVFDKIFSPVFPCVHPIMYFVARILISGGDPDHLDFGLRVLDEDGQLAATPAGLQVPRPQAAGPDGEQVTLQLVLQIGNATFERAGTYTFELRGNGQVLAEAEVRVLPLVRRPST